MSIELMQILAYLIVGAAVVFYVVLDGFDLGVGILQIFAGDDKDRRIFLNSIGPFWDGNEVWLIAIVGALFVAFPDVYAILLSGFYLLIMLMLLGIITRAVAIEFRSKEESLAWRYTWDTIFWLASVIITFAAGVLLGNLLLGVPITAERELYLPFLDNFHPYSIFMGIFSIALFAMHGNIFLLTKTEGDLQKKLHNYAKVLIPLFFLFFIAATVWTWTAVPRITGVFLDYPVFFIVPAILALSMLCIPYLLTKKRYGYTFLFSMIAIVLLFSLALIGTFPNMIPSSLDYMDNTLTIYNASAQRMTLGVTLVIAVIGIPMVIFYGIILYTVFRGKTVLTDHSY
ncbi:MAG: Cytochrome bd-I ubiquinol oxidase subunit 2 [Chlamydiia bacterium]|nr:Cytochrome bd-I ubiquinol oxidase subunit 2 [Chlamydiia bacterium]MCH9618064.1 Cytochrome bd-I ubiquinol oxidase subunit 2 [Chlamydiia bacterium]MCH9624694.1 Cytochrome bd-I ubiquinol oxidase subunit 2 [Chlamydiia bacterium]